MSLEALRLIDRSHWHPPSSLAMTSDFAPPETESESPAPAALVAQVRERLASATASLARLTDEQIFQALGDGLLNQLLLSIAPLRTEAESKGELVYDFLLRHKHGLQMIAWLRRTIMAAYSYSGTVDGKRAYVSPDVHQWYPDGVMFVQGEQPFDGYLGLYRDEKVLFAITARDIREGEDIRPGDLVYVDVSVALEHISRQRPGQNYLRRAVAELTELLDQREESESAYQRFFERYPRAFGAQYSSVNSHEALDDRNIPDFSGARVRDGSRDILEIKSPFFPLFRADGDFSAEFLRAWVQVERYLDFARREQDYLRRQRGLRFENPHCYLILGYALSDSEIDMLRARERMNPAITILTYNDLLTLVTKTAEFFESLQTR